MKSSSENSGVRGRRFCGDLTNPTKLLVPLRTSTPRSFCVMYSRRPLRASLCRSSPRPPCSAKGSDNFVGNISVGVVNATTDGVAAGPVGGNPALLWSSLALSALSMAYGFYSGCARMDRVFSEKDETPPVVAGHRVWVFVGILVQVVWALAALGSVWGSALPPAVRLGLPLAFVGNLVWPSGASLHSSTGE